MAILSTRNLSKSYQMGEVEVKALVDTTFQVEEGEFVVILGPSGSGKSTLLNLIGGMDTPTQGQVFLRDEEVTAYNERELTAYRRNKVGFVFQFYNIMANLTARENVELATEISQNPLDIDQVMEAVDLSQRQDHFPSQLSGGEQQRVSIARAVAKNPEILLCDEPTGALDYNTGISILSLLKRVNREMGKTLLVITHNGDIARIADRVIKMRSGQIIEDILEKSPLNVEDIKW